MIGSNTQNIETPKNDQGKNGLTEKARNVFENVTTPLYKEFRADPEFLAVANKVAASPKDQIATQDLAALNEKVKALKSQATVPQISYLDQMIVGVA